MGSSISFLLSLVFVIELFVFGVDMINIQAVYTELDTISFNVGFLVAKEGFVSEQTLQYISSFEGTRIIYEPYSPSFGDLFEFVIERDCHPFLLGGGDLTIRVNGATVIGYYN